MDLGLAGRTALVTGASRGIGKAIANGLAAEGVHVALVARGREELARTADEIRATHHVRVFAVPADVGSEVSVQAAATAAGREFSTVHILINNAGSPIKRQDRQLLWPDSDWQDDLNTKILGTLRMTKAVLPLMPHDGTGRVINISGIAGVSALGPALTHGLNNAAMNQATSYLAKDLASAHITVNAVIPGLIATEWRESWAAAGGSRGDSTGAEAFVADVCREWGVVSGRWGTMAEVADVVVFLASDRASYVNGARIAVDGGYSINAR